MTRLTATVTERMKSYLFEYCEKWIAPYHGIPFFYGAHLREEDKNSAVLENYVDYTLDVFDNMFIVNLYIKKDGELIHMERIFPKRHVLFSQTKALWRYGDRQSSLIYQFPYKTLFK